MKIHKHKRLNEIEKTLNEIERWVLNNNKSPESSVAKIELSDIVINHSIKQEEPFLK